MVCPICSSWMYQHAEFPKHKKCSCGYTCHEKQEMAKDLVTCNGCNWVSFRVSRLKAEEEVVRFVDYYNTLTEEQKYDYYDGRVSSISDYERCFSCGGSYKNFRPAKITDCPDGCTINPIIQED